MNKEEYIAKLNSIRGLFAVEIILGHVVRHENSFIHLIGRFMIISVAFFFFVSGMGMSISFEKKNNYLEKFVWRKCGYLVFLALFVYLFSTVTSIFVPPRIQIVPQSSCPVLNFITNTNWYIWELLAFYLLFYVLHKYCRSRKMRLLLLLIATTVIMIVSYVFLYEAFYASAMAFPLGVFWGYYYDEIKKRMCRTSGIALTLMFTLLGLSCFIFTKENFVTMVLLRNSMCVGSIFLLFYVITHIKIEAKGIIRFLTKYSTELYLFQFVCFAYIDTKSLNWMLNFLIVFLLTIACALITRPVISYVRRKCFS